MIFVLMAHFVDVISWQIMPQHYNVSACPVGAIEPLVQHQQHCQRPLGVRSKGSLPTHRYLVPQLDYHP